MGGSEVALQNDRFVSYAQNLEDVMLWRALRDAAPDGGFYIDAGAADPTALSVTRAFHDRGWRGINIEPLPQQAAALRRARPRDVVVQAALGAAPGTRTFYRVEMLRQTGLSTFDAETARRHEAAGAVVAPLEMEVTTLAEICRKHAPGPVHFLKIDVEGAEAETLAGADFAACRPWIVLVEATPPLDAAPAALPWEPGLLAAGYRHVWFDGLNRFYLADEHSDLARHFTVPPNVFDRYAVYDAPLQDHVATAEALAAARLRDIEALQREVAALNSAAPRTLPAAAPLAPPAPPPPLHRPAPAIAAAPPKPPPRRSLKRRLALLAYAPFRPFLRPLAWRVRTFFTAELQRELDGHRIRLDQLIARPVHGPAPAWTPSPGGAPAPDAKFGAAIEGLLLTLALEDAGRSRRADGDEAFSKHGPAR